jgi:alpha-1,2-mannosyltransferase
MRRGAPRAGFRSSTRVAWVVGIARAPMSRRWSLRPGGWPILRALLLAGVVGVACWYVALGAAHPWDFETYYYAASAWRAGQDPYLLESLAAIAGKSVSLPFLYPPIAILVFLPFTYVPIAAAGFLWLGLKMLLVPALLWIWRRDFLRPQAPDLLIAVALLGFNLALLWDLRTGNAALLEETLLWIAFAAYVRGRRSAFVCLVAVASIFKLYPILFLGLALVPSGARKGSIRSVAAGLAIFAALLALPVRGQAQWMVALGGTLAGGRPIGDINPSALGLADWALATGGVPPGHAAWLGWVIYAVYCVLLLYASGRGLHRARRSGSPREVVLAAILLWLLLAPRVMVYSYVMAVVPALAVVGARLKSLHARTAALGFVLLPGIVRLLPGRAPEPAGALPFLFILWAWLLYSSSRRAGPLILPPGAALPEGIGVSVERPDVTGRGPRA